MKMRLESSLAIRKFAAIAPIKPATTNPRINALS